MQITVNGKDISNRCGNVKREDDIDGLAECLSFDMAYNPNDKYFGSFEVNVGDKVVFKNDSYTFAGIITDESRDGQYKRTYQSYDYAWYLNKNEVVVQFVKMTAAAAIKKLCDDFSIKCKLCSLPTKISKIYNGEILSNVIKDILSQVEADQAKSYRMEMRNNELIIEPYSKLVVKAQFKPAINLAPVDPLKSPSDVSITKSIANMANSVKVTTGNESSAVIVAEQKDEKSIAKYGLLQKVESLSDGDKATAGNVAKNKLLELNKIDQKVKVTFLGDDAVRSGRIIVYNGKGYQVISCKHSYSPQHTMTLGLEAIE